MAVQADVTEALDGDRDELIEVLAAHRLLPTVVDRGGGSSLLGKSTTPAVKFESHSEESGTIDRQTSLRVVDALELHSEEACDSVREEIESHDAWA